MARQKIEVEIKVVGTQAQVKIKQLDDAFRDAAKGADMMNEAINNGSKLLKGSVGDLKRQIKALELVRDNTAKTTKQFFEQDKQIQKLRNRVSAITDTNSKFAKVNQDLISSSGLAGATLTELGRTISDMPYGIRGVTNNLSQLSTLMVTLMAKTGGTTKAFQLLGAQLRGPLGLILAFQAVIAAIDFFFGSTKKAEEATDDFTDSLNVNLEVTRIYLEALKDTNNELEDRLRLLNAVSTRHSNLQKILSDESLTISERTEKAEEFLKLEADRLALTDLSKKEEDQLFKARENLTNKQNELNEALKVKNTLDEQALDEGFVSNAERIADATKDRDDAQRELNLTTKALIEFETQIARIKKLQNDLIAKNTELKLDNLAVDEMTMTFQEAFAGYFDTFTDPLTVLEDLYDDGISALLEFNRFREQFIERSELEILDIMQNAAISRLKELADESEGLIDFETEKTKILEFFAKKRAEITREELKRNVRELQDMLGQLQNVMNMMTDAEFSREERKTVMLNNQLKERLRNEQLSADERERINKQIENNELKLQKKRDEIAERNFKLQKAFAMAQAAINTALAVSDVLAREKKGLIGKTAAAIIIGALGAAQIAAIAKTKFVPSASAMPSGQAGVVGSAGGGAQDPIFNIVGTGQQFQLSQAIAQRTGEPVRAYVVTGDVRSGLALERNIIKGSKLG